MKMVALFAGVGGLERGMMVAGHELKAVAEIDPHACAVLERRFPEVPNLGDVEALASLPACDIVTAGFPCQDLSQAGGTAGIHGNKSRLVRRALDLIENAKRRPAWLLLENVPFMLTLHRGSGMSWLVRRLEHLGYRWAYRVIDTRAFGLPHRRRRLFILASRVARPAGKNLSAQDFHSAMSSGQLFRLDTRLSNRVRPEWLSDLIHRGKFKSEVCQQKHLMLARNASANLSLDLTAVSGNRHLE